MRLGKSQWSITWGNLRDLKMPLSQEQISLLKNPLTKVMFVEDNPKRPGTKAWERFAKYRQQLTISEANEKGAQWQDLSMEIEKLSQTRRGQHGH